MNKIKHLALAVSVFTLLSITALASDTHLEWLGHAAFQYTTKDGKVILIDPWLTNPKAPKKYKPSRVDAILVTHGHFDHVGEAFELAKKFKAPLVASYELTEIAKAKGVKNVQPLNPQGSADIAGVTVTAVSAVHSSGYADRRKGTLYAGAPLGFVLAEKGAPVVYHAGDTGVYGDMALTSELYHPDVALLPIGGVFTMKPAEAAVAARLLKAKAVVPIHWGTFPALTGTPAELKSAVEKAGLETKVVELKVGADVAVKSLY